MYSGATGGHKKLPTGGEEYISDTVMVASIVLEWAFIIVHDLHNTLCKEKTTFNSEIMQQLNCTFLDVCDIVLEFFCDRKSDSNENLYIPLLYSQSR